MRTLHMAALLSSLWLVALPAGAQIIERQKKTAPAPAAPTTTTTPPVSDDDDILAPLQDPTKPKPVVQKAKKVGLIGLVPVGEAQKPLADQVGVGVSKELNESQFAVLPLTISSPTAGGAGAGDDAAAQAAVASADTQLQKAEPMLQGDRIQPGKAITGFKAAIAGYEKGASLTVDRAPLLRAWVGLATAYALQGLDKESKDALRTVAVLDPEYELDKAAYPPQFVRTHQGERDAVMSQPKARLFVDETGTGAEVFIDGRSVGAAPVRVTELPQGRHFVRVARVGQSSFGQVVDVAGDAEAVVSPGFLKKGATGALDELAQNKLSDASVKQIADAALSAGMDAALVGVVARSSRGVPAALVLVDAKGGGAIVLPPMLFQGDLLDLSIEIVKSKELIEPALGDAKLFKPIGDTTLLEGVSAGEGAKVQDVAMRYEFQAAPKDRKSRLGGPPAAEDAPPRVADAPTTDEAGRAISAGESGGRRTSLRDEESPFAAQERARVDDVEPEDRTLLQQPWFWPVVIGGAAGGVVVLGAGAVVGAVALGFDPRPTGGADVVVTAPNQ